jgi:hypothetical protein
LTFVFIGEFMSSIFLVAICALAVPAVLQLFLKWIYLPIKIRHKHPPLIEQPYVVTTNEKLTSEQRDLIGKYVHEFAAEGFDVAANLSIERGKGQVSAVLVLLVNRVTGDVAQMILTLINLRRNCVILIRSHFADGREVVTGYNPEVGFMPRNQRVDLINFGWVRRVNMIAEAHRRRLAHMGLSDKPRITPMAGCEIEYLQEHRKAELARFVECGYFYRDQAAGVLRKTWKGTFLAPWKLQQPIKKIRITLRDRKALRTWIELGMDRWSRDAAPVGAMSPPIEPRTQNNFEREPASLGYQTNLAAGELRIHRSDSSAVVRLGKPSVSSYLLMRWATILWIIVDLYICLIALPGLWLIYQLRLFGPFPIGIRVGGLLTSIAVLLYLFLSSVFSLIRGLRRTRGTSVISATREGLHFENAPARRSAGFIRRDELQNLLIVRREVRFFKSLHQLEASILNKISRQPLLVGTSAAQLAEARKAIAFAVGIERETHPERLPN